MSILVIIATIAIVGVICWFLLSLPMPPIFKNLIIVVLAIFAIVMVLKFFGLSVGIPGIH